MPYTPNPADPTQPTSSVMAGTAAAEFRALKTYLASLSVGSAAALAADLLKGTDSAKGDAMIASKLLQTGAVATTVHQVNEDFVYADRFKLDTDPDDTLSIQRALNLGLTVLLRDKDHKTYTVSNLQSVAGAGLICPFGTANITVAAGSNKYGIKINTPGFTLGNIKFSGGNTGPYNIVSGGVVGTRNGFIVGNIFGTGATIDNLRIYNIECEGFDVAGMQGGEIQIGFSFGKKATLDDVNCHDCCIGLWAAERFEYITATNCHGYKCYAGIIMQGGNNTWVGCHFENCWQNCQLAAGENNSHGSFVGCSFNHAEAGGYGLYAVGVQYGETFTGCQFWYSPIFMQDCAGIHITDSIIAGGTPSVTVNAGGVNSISRNYCPNGLSRTFIGNTFTVFRENRTTATDGNRLTKFKDVEMLAVSSSAYVYPFVWNSTVDATLPMNWADQYYNGVVSGFLSPANNFYAPQAGYYTLKCRVRFSCGAADQQVILKAVKNLGTAPALIDQDGRFFINAATDCTVDLNCRAFLAAGDTVDFRMKVSSATGITVTSGGIYTMIYSDQ